MTVELPVLPAHWGKSRVDRVASVNARIGWKALTAAEYQPQGFTFLSTPNIKGREIDFDNVNYITEFRYQESPELKLREGDVLLVKDGNTLGIVNLVKHLPRPATVNGSIAVIRPTGIDGAFLRYVLESRVTQAAINMLKGGMGVPHLFQWDINRLPIPVPPLEEQRRIADFLDTETATIESYANLHERLFSVLREKTSGVIESLLLYGDTQPQNDAPVTDSAPFPSRFPIGRLKHVASRVDVGIAEAATHAYASDGVPLIRSTNIRSNSLDVRDLLHIAPSFAERNRSKYVFAGDILTVRTGNAGVSAVVPQDLNRSQTFTQLITTLRDENSAEYFCQFLNSRVCRQYFDLVSWGSAQKNISVPLLANTPVPIPPTGLQREISASIKSYSEAASSLASKVHRARQLASERRQALITAAVTGQFDVSTASGRNVTDGVIA
ncbi:restriction endonuclease subunit S [Streptomyces mirabilis]|uniref:restriction endonuclease subunit S n=1 Tax=Streptomyces mirabilis TaxID=68239 RepID=UPI003645DCFF